MALDPTGEIEEQDKPFDAVEWNAKQLREANIKLDMRAIYGTGSGIGGRGNPNDSDEAKAAKKNEEAGRQARVSSAIIRETSKISAATQELITSVNNGTYDRNQSLTGMVNQILETDGERIDAYSEDNPDQYAPEYREELDRRTAAYNERDPETGELTEKAQALRKLDPYGLNLDPSGAGEYGPGPREGVTWEDVAAEEEAKRATEATQTDRVVGSADPTPIESDVAPTNAFTAAAHDTVEVGHDFQNAKPAPAQDTTTPENIGVTEAQYQKTSLSAHAPV